MYVGYLRDLSIHGPWYSQGILEPDPQNTKGQLHVFLIVVHSITVSYAFWKSILIFPNSIILNWFTGLIWKYSGLEPEGY